MSIASNFLQLALVAVARDAWVMFLAVAAGVISNLISSGCKSFITQIVAVDEIGKVFTGFGIAADVATIVGTALYSAIYYATESFFPQLTFWFIAGLMVFCFIIVSWVHVMFQRETKRSLK